MTMPRRRRPTIEQRAEELLHQAENSRRRPGSYEELVQLWGWVPVLEREALQVELETATDDDAMLAAMMRAEAALLLAQRRKAKGLPRY
jgi:hypothetical protein